MQKYKFIDSSLIFLMRRVIIERGREIIKDKRFVNILDDYKAFENNDFIKHIILLLQKEEIMDIFNEEDYGIKLKGFISKIIRKYMLQEKPVEEIVEAMEKALKKKEIEKDDYLYSLEKFEKEADKGDSYAQYIIGKCYEEGIIKERNEKNAFDWYLKAAEQGYAEAQLKLGNMYEKKIILNFFEGQEIYYEDDLNFDWSNIISENGNNNQEETNNQYERNIYDDYLWACQDIINEKAMFWWGKAAEQGNAEAEFKYAMCFFDIEAYNMEILDIIKDYYNYTFGDCGYLVGINGEMDIDKSLVYIRKSAEKGFVVAQKLLGLCYKNGWGVTKNIPKSTYWLEKSTKKKNGYI